MTKMQIVTVMLSALTCCCPVVQAGDAEKLARLCAANTAAVESIRTLYCKVKIESAMDRWHIPGGEYWRSGGMERYFFVHKGHENRCVIRDGVVKIMVKQDITDSLNMKGDKEVKESLEGDRYFWHAGIERYNGTSRFLFKPWLGAMCCTSDGGKSGNVTVAGFAANHAKDVRSVSQGHIAGVSTEVVEYRLSGVTSTVHFDPSANYMVRKSGSESDASTQYAGSSEVTSFKEYAPGVFFPERVVVKRWSDGRPEADEVITFYDVRINQPMPDSTFDFKFRHGIYLTDRIEGKVYKVDVTGKPIGEKRPMLVAAPIPVSPDAPANSPRAETREEPGRSGWWLLPASMTILGVSGALLLVRRSRNRSRDA